MQQKILDSWNIQINKTQTQIHAIYTIYTSVKLKDFRFKNYIEITITLFEELYLSIIGDDLQINSMF